jgi:hypothetical protein
MSEVKASGKSQSSEGENLSAPPAKAAPRTTKQQEYINTVHEKNKAIGQFYIDDMSTPSMIQWCVREKPNHPDVYGKELHVIIYDAYAALQKECEELRERLQRYVTCPCCNESFSFENAMSEYQYKLDKENATLRECLSSATDAFHRYIEAMSYFIIGYRNENVRQLDGTIKNELIETFQGEQHRLAKETLAKIKSKMGDV